MRIEIKPLSVNKAWQGRRFKTKMYKEFEEYFLMLLPSNYKIPSGGLRLYLEYGFSSKASDVDNPTKMVVDVLSKKYGFNDNRIYSLRLEKKIVKKGSEYIYFSFDKYLLDEEI